ncbi:MAG: hypothetical protein K2X87_18635 [Gemmataceae bacterium]|nr:hypothetical protein [Gemmataceae bacterium]
MASEGKLVRWDEAGLLINSISDPIKQRLVIRAVTIARNRFRSGMPAPDVDLDIKFLTDVILELFEDLDIVRKELAGEQPGAWFDND